MSVRIGVVARGIELPLAEKAVAAGDGEGHHHAIAALQIRDGWTHLLHNPHELVTHDVPRFHGRHKAVIEVEVGAADGRTRDPDDRVMRVQQRGIGHVVYFHVSLTHPADSLHTWFLVPSDLWIPHAAERAY